MRGLDGKTAIISGGATLIGESCAAVLAGYGVDVVIADINEADGKAVAERIGDKASFIRADITSDDDIAALVAATVEKHERLDFLVNVACTYLDNGAETARADWLKALDVNIVGSVMLMQAARPHLKKQQGRDRQFRLDLGARRPDGPLGLSGVQGGDPAADPQPGAGPRAGRHPRQCGLAGLDLEQHHGAADQRQPRQDRQRRGALPSAGPHRRSRRRSAKPSPSCCRTRRASSPAPTSGSTAATRRWAPSGSIRRYRC